MLEYDDLLSLTVSLNASIHGGVWEFGRTRALVSFLHEGDAQAAMWEMEQGSKHRLNKNPLVS
jgi:hypothetical protein